MSTSRLDSRWDNFWAETFPLLLLWIVVSVCVGLILGSIVWVVINFIIVSVPIVPVWKSMIILVAIALPIIIQRG